MKIILNGKRVRKEWVAWYDKNQACFKKEVLKKRKVLHELYHHLIASKGFILKKELKKRKRMVVPEPSRTVIKNYVGKYCDNLIERTSGIMRYDYFKTSVKTDDIVLLLA